MPAGEEPRAAAPTCSSIPNEPGCQFEGIPFNLRDKSIGVTYAIPKLEI